MSESVTALNLGDRVRHLCAPAGGLGTVDWVYNRHRPQRVGVRWDNTGKRTWHERDNDPSIERQG